MKDVINTHQLSRSFGSFKAVSDLSLTVGKGEIYGFIGLNGAGKTTTIRMLLGMIKPDSGEVNLFDEPVKPGNTYVWKRVGYMVEAPHHYPGLTVEENLNIMRDLRGIKEKKAVETIMEELNIAQFRNRKAKDLSQGNAQRLGLAKAMMHKPDLLILDEPANALDPAGIVEIRNLLSHLARNHGVTVFISSHILGEISRVASRIGIISNGKLIQEVTSDELKALCRERLVIESNDRETAFSRLKEHGYEVNINPEKQLEITDEEAIQHPEEIARLMVYDNVAPKLLKVEREDLESYFLRIIESQKVS
ncbi:MAG: ATP-binding cassette domain-containing protein [Bacteroidetes bacterium]|nr:ATP-binding cassette domain-containing protein [Bacteroidota bacterium]